MYIRSLCSVSEWYVQASESSSWAVPFTDMGRNHHRQKLKKQFWNQWLKWHNLACCMCWFVEFGIPKLNFSTSQLSEAQEKAKNKTSQSLVFQILEVTLPKQKLKIFKRCQTTVSKFRFRAITFQKGHWNYLKHKSLSTGLIFYEVFWPKPAFTGSQL